MDGRSAKEVSQLDTWAKEAFSRLIVARDATTISVALAFMSIFGDEPDTVKAMRQWINQKADPTQ